jgi:hypothetical protein
MARKENRAVSQFVTENASVNHTVTWTIENLPHLINIYQYGGAFKSPEFEIRVVGTDSKLVSTIWDIECYPSGNARMCCEFVSLYLCLSNKSELNGTAVQGAIKCSLSTKFKVTPETNPFTLSGGTESFFVFISHKDLSAKPENYLIGKKLKLKFEISLLPLAGLQTHQLGIRSSELPKQADVDASAWGRQAWTSLKAGGSTGYGTA